MSTNAAIESPVSAASVEVAGVRFDRVREPEVVERVLAELAAGRGGWIVTPNLEILRQLSESAALRRWFAKADLVLADGMPLVWSSRLTGDPLPERVAGSSLISTLSGGAARAGRSIYLLGGSPGTAEGAARELQKRHPGLRVAGTGCPKPGFEQSATEMEQIQSGVEAARPDIVFVALGCPKQERLIRTLRPILPRTWFMGVGISFSYLSGDVRRAPRWVRKVGLEWMYRLMQEPERLARRYLVHDVPFALRLLWRSALERRRRRSRGGKSRTMSRTREIPT